MSPPPPKPAPKKVLSERTMMIDTSAVVRPPASGRTAPLAPAGGARAWRAFRFANLEKISRLQQSLARRLEWMLPGIGPTGEVSETVPPRGHSALTAAVCPNAEE